MSLNSGKGFLHVAAGDGPIPDTKASVAWVEFENSETMTLATGGATTDSTAYLLPASSFISGVCYSVATAITHGGAMTSFHIGDGTVAARFASTVNTFTAGASGVGILHLMGGVAADNAGPGQAAAAKLRITANGANPTAGAVTVTVTGWMSKVRQ